MAHASMRACRVVERAPCHCAPRSLGDWALVQQHIAALHMLLAVAAASDALAAVEDGAVAMLASPSSPALITHLISLLAGLLVAAPPALSEEFFTHHLRWSPLGMHDACHLAQLAALVRASALVEAAAPGASGCGAATAVQALLVQHADALREVGQELVGMALRSKGGGMCPDGGGALAGGDSGAVTAYLSSLADLIRWALLHPSCSGADNEVGCSG